MMNIPTDTTLTVPTVRLSVDGSSILIYVGISISLDIDGMSWPVSDAEQSQLRAWLTAGNRTELIEYLRHVISGLDAISITVK